MKESKKFATVSEELKGLFDSDQADRISSAFFKNKAAQARDKVRLKRAEEIYADFLKEILDLGGDDLYHLAMIFQHSTCKDAHGRTIINTHDIKVAFELATLAATKGSEDGALLSAKAEDRYLLQVGKKQKWGTQFTAAARKTYYVPKDFFRSPMQSDRESGITDAMRKEKGVPPRRMQLREFLKRE